MSHYSRTKTYLLLAGFFYLWSFTFVLFSSCSEELPPIPLSFLSTVTGFSASPSNNHDKGNKDKSNIPSSFKLKWTASIEPTSEFHKGSEARKERLDAELSLLGVNVTQLTTLPKYRGTAALRAYSSFILPKSKGALAVAESPTRASVVSNNIHFLLTEHEAHSATWLRNHDKTIQELQMNNITRHPLYIILDNVRSAHNVGNIVRACEAASIQQVCLCGSQSPNMYNQQLLKTAMGATDYVNYSIYDNTLDCIQELKRLNVTIVGVETTTNATEYWKYEYPKPLALVFGNEMVGISVQVLKECDAILKVPMYGMKNSINVATCVSVLLWESLRQWRDSLE